jgi:hypothetical protein
LPTDGEYLYAFRVETKTALVLGGGGITGGMCEPGAIAAMDDFVVLRESFSRPGMEVSLEHLIARRKPTAPIRGVSR